MSQKIQVHFKNPVAFATRFLQGVWPFWDITHSKFKALDFGMSEIYFSTVLKL